MIKQSFQPRFSGSVFERAGRRALAAGRRARDRLAETYLPDASAAPGQRYFQPLEIERYDGWESTFSELGENYIGHRFDILGSGWTNVHHGMSCPGVEGNRYEAAPALPDGRQAAHLTGRLNASNRRAALNIRALIDEDFTPIDWHLDFKSGYRWRESVWYRDIRYRGVPGADAKLPWELARMHHLAQLALAHGLAAAKRPGFRGGGDYAREFRNQALDFIAANPPRYGINWCCTMDVAIRAANLLVAHDLFGATGHAFDAAFENIFWRSMREHGRHIAANLERHGAMRNNHYLANIAGLLFVGAYLPAGGEADPWLAFAARELLAESEYQFLGDGANFESSTSYHRLSAEMMLYGTALLLAIPEARGIAPLPDQLSARLAAMAEFSIAITTPAGRIVQIGDNDSGRFLKLFPLFENEALTREAHLDHRHLVAAISALSDDPSLTSFTGADHPERELVSALARGKKLPPTVRAEITDHGTGEASELGEFLETWKTAAPANRQFARFALAEPFDAARIAFHSYAEFGLYILRAPEFYLAIRCGGENAGRPRGHAHNDQLSVELWIGGECLLADPGSYLYTPLPERRNAYRSVRAHFAPQIEGAEPASLDLGLFALGPPSGAECRYFGAAGFLGCHSA
ncbi:MAG: heparinase II/III family protein, partial [Alphaproteobacteria bacterium]|nr:heparinase II/III family protein [Alphaproteobacteria bacterium]